MTTDRIAAATPYPNGWYCAVFSHQLARGEVKTVAMFGKEVVVFRTEDGRACAVDPYCPHFGAHLGRGGAKVVGETLRCPFHGWRYAGDTGRCVHIPTGDPIPPNARLSRRYVEEVSGMVLVWHHAQGAAPGWRVPPLQSFDETDWGPWHGDDWTVTATIQDISENDADGSHSPIMHGFTSERPEQEMEIEGARFTWKMRMKPNFAAIGLPLKGRIPGAISHVRSERYGLAIGWITQEMPLLGGITFRTQTLATTTPIDERTVSLQMIHRAGRLPLRLLTRFASRQYARLFRETVDQDITVWQHKVYLDRPCAAKSDASILHFRRWARQFYSGGVPSAEDGVARAALVGDP